MRVGHQTLYENDLQFKKIFYQKPKLYPFCKLVEKNCNKLINVLYQSKSEKKTIININSCENLIQTLEDVFGDPNKKVIPPKTLITLCQYKRPFFRYWPAFHIYKSQN